VCVCVRTCVQGIPFEALNKKEPSYDILALVDGYF
jgi:hypothetical protein